MSCLVNIVLNTVIPANVILSTGSLSQLILVIFNLRKSREISSVLLTLPAGEDNLSIVESPPVSEDVISQDQSYLSPLLSFHLPELSSGYFDLKPSSGKLSSLLGDGGESGLCCDVSSICGEQRLTEDRLA